MSDDIDNDLDETAEKAKALGKELGVADEDLPDYEINEVADEDDASLKKETKAERAAAAADNLSKSQEKRQRRKQKLDSVIGGKDAIIEAQARKLEELERRMVDVDNRFSGLNKAEIEKQWRDNAAVYNNAKLAVKEAFTEGDADKHMAALETLKHADDRAKELQNIYNQVSATPAKTMAPASDTIIVNKANAWAKENSWYNANSNDTDSVVAKAIAGALVKEGYDPKNDDYWDELTDRVSSRIPGAVQDDDASDEDIIEPKVRKQKTPPVNGGAKRGDGPVKRTITLPTSYIEKMKREVPEIWADPKRRARLLADRERILRENG